MSQGGGQVQFLQQHMNDLEWEANAMKSLLKSSAGFGGWPIAVVLLALVKLLGLGQGLSAGARTSAGKPAADDL